MIKRLQQEARALRWVKMLSGSLAIGHRPKLSAMKTLREQGASHVLTLLSDAEGARTVGGAARREGIQWLWFPMSSASPPNDARLPEVRDIFERIIDVLKDGGRIYVHCSAGIHRTGMFVYGLLRYAGMSACQARRTLRLLRPITMEQVGGGRLAWGDSLGRPDHPDQVE